MSVVTATYRFSGEGEDFGRRKGRRLVILHTFENSDPLKNTMRDALAGAKWQDRNDVLGSYNRLVATDGVLSCVPDGRISGGVNPASTYFKPTSWLYKMLPATVVNDPNSYALQLCAMGQRAYYDAHGWPQSIIDGFAWSIIEEERATGAEMVVANHAHFQPGNRSDAGRALELVMDRIPQLLALPDTATEQPDVELPLREKYQEWTTVVGATFFTDAPGAGRKVFTQAVRLVTVAESVDFSYRLGIINGEVIYVPRTSIMPRVTPYDVAYDTAVKAALARTQDPRLATAQGAIAKLQTRLGEAKILGGRIAAL